MATTSVPWTEELVEAAGSKLHIIKGGTGQPLLLLHDEMGHPGWLRYHAALAQHYTLYIPLHPGCGQSDHLDWVMNMRDLAFWYLDALDELGLGQVPVIGGSLGGWLAAEMAAMCPQQFKRLVLVGAMGVRPPVGEIFDMFLVVSREYLRASFTDRRAQQRPSNCTVVIQHRNRRRAGSRRANWRVSWGGGLICMTRVCRTPCAACASSRPSSCGGARMALCP
jgi:pimeloyl-ACP methyl ester carboxylesterase